MTTKNAAMSAYLNLNANTKTKPNENYAREIMELFCLGPTHPDTGAPNYAQADIEGLTRAFTGWRLNGTEFLPDGVTPNPDYGKITFAPSQFTMTAKTILGRTIPAVTGSTNPATATNLAWGPSAVNQAIDIVLERAVHPQFLIRKLWSEFIASPIPQATLDSLISAYRGSNPKYQLRPVIRGILMSPLIFESLDEPNLVKPPIIFMVGVLRQLGAPLQAQLVELQGAMNDMQQRIYQPPNVAGWEGGMSWFNTNTVQGRFDMIVRAQYLRYTNYYATGATTAIPVATDIDPETAAGRRATARTLSVEPPVDLGRDARTRLIAWAGSMPATDPTPRRERAAALLRAAGDDPRRPRRAGDVGALHRVRGDRTRPRPRRAPVADDAGAVRGARRLPGRPHPARPDAPPAAAVGRRRHGVDLRRQGARLGHDLGVGRGRPRRGRRTSASCCSTWPAATTA